MIIIVTLLLPKKNSPSRLFGFTVTVLVCSTPSSTRPYHFRNKDFSVHQVAQLYNPENKEILHSNLLGIPPLVDGIHKEAFDSITEEMIEKHTYQQT